ncbi:Carboxynorspermidine synthase [archaeon HR01]|nr:Carboxynorspermidine synthase [archaeon HR01]
MAYPIIPALSLYCGVGGMRVLLLGVGSVGEVIARHLHRESKISLTAVDRDWQRLRKVRRAIRERKVVLEKIERIDDRSFIEVLNGSDIVINAATPTVNLELMKLCQRYRVNYMDLASDDLDRQLKMDGVWRRSGLLGLICMGEDPGLSNLYARYASNKLDKIYEIRVRDGEYSTSSKYPLISLFSPEIYLSEITSPAHVFLDGRLRRLPSFSGYELYSFPNPVGTLPVYHVSHEEVYTLPRFIGKGLQYVDFKLVIPDEVVRAVRLLKRLGLLAGRKVRVGDASVAPRDLLLTLIPKPWEISRDIKGHACLVVDVVGEKKGRRALYSLYTHLSHEEAYKMFGCNATAYLTGTVPAVVAKMLAEGKIEGQGVLTPELLHPDPIIEEIAKKHVDSYLKSSQEGRIEKIPKPD